MMSDHTAGPAPARPLELTIAEIVERLEPMGDLGRFVIEDLSPAEEDEFFSILNNA